jgi:hypothetical protein
VTSCWRSVVRLAWAPPRPDKVIHLGGEAAVGVPMSVFLRLRALEQAASYQELEDAEDKAAQADWRAREAPKGPHS